MRWARTGQGRSLGDAFSEHGTSFPTVEVVKPVLAADPEWPVQIGTPRGVPSAGRGWSSVPVPPLPTFRATSREIGGIFPFLTDTPLPGSGPNMGQNAKTGAGWHFDLTRLVRMGILSNTNVTITGKPGRGKSGIVKCYLNRSVAYDGASFFVPGDLKDEYEHLVRYWGNEPVKAGPGLATRINPLDPGPLAHGWTGLSENERRKRWEHISRRWNMLLPGLLDTVGVSVDASARMTIATVLDDMTATNRGGLLTLPTITIPQVWQALLSPSDAVLRARRYSAAEELIHDNRQLIDGLGALCKTTLKGMFDEETNISIDWSAPAGSLSLRALEKAEKSVQAAALLCASSWGTEMSQIGDGRRRIIPRDEAWRALRMGPNAIDAFDSDLRLSRDQDTENWLIFHQFGDLAAAGDEGTQASALAKQFTNLCDTKILLAQDAGEADIQASALRLNDDEAQIIRPGGWAHGQKGRALWQLGDRSFRVNNIWTPLEKTMFDTNDKLTGYDQPDTAEVA